MCDVSISLRNIRRSSCGLYYKPISIVNYDSSIINKLETSLIDDARVFIYDCHMFIVQTTGVDYKKTFLSKFTNSFW